MNPRRHLIIPLLLCISLTEAHAARFVPLGFLPGGPTGPGYPVSIASGQSADGSVVVGVSGDAYFRWTEATGMTSLGVGPNGMVPYGGVPVISGDGQVIVGTLGNVSPFKWTQDDGFTLIAPRLRDAVAISFDGSVVIARYDGILLPGVRRGVSWDGATIVGQDYD
jgi:uncharacterized membrane protein